MIQDLGFWIKSCLEVHKPDFIPAPIDLKAQKEPNSVSTGIDPLHLTRTAEYKSIHSKHTNF